MDDQLLVRLYRVGLGDCIYLRVPDDGAARHILIDCGNRYAAVGELAAAIEDLDPALAAIEHVDVAHQIDGQSLGTVPVAGDQPFAALVTGRKARCHWLCARLLRRVRRPKRIPVTLDRMPFRASALACSLWCVRRARRFRDGSFARLARHMIDGVKRLPWRGTHIMVLPY